MTSSQLTAAGIVLAFGSLLGTDGWAMDVMLEGII